ncbi:MAG: M48 family metallopeptidase [Pseudomonadales bacterium]
MDAELEQRLIIEDIPVEVRPNSRRRTRIGVVLDPQGFVVLDAPPNVSMEEVRAVITEHRRWLWHKLKALDSRDTLSSRLSYADGEVLHLLGKTLTLQLLPGLFESLVVTDKQVLITSPQTDPHHIKALLTRWYQEQAQLAFAQVLADYAELPWLESGVPPWKHRYMRSQWGSCSASGRLSLNTHLVKTPRRLIEYVVLHELCHLKHHNHSRRFHGLVTQYMPDWDARSNELNKYLPILMQD